MTIQERKAIPIHTSSGTTRTHTRAKSPHPWSNSCAARDIGRHGTAND